MIHGENVDHAPSPHDATTIEKLSPVTTAPPRNMLLLMPLRNRKTSGFSLSISYVAPHWGHLRAVFALEESCCDA